MGNREKIREKNLIPFVKGKSGNPNGRPVGQRNYATIYREAMIKLAKKNNSTPEALEDEMIANGAVLARKGNYQFYKDTLDRLHGTPVHNADIKSDGKAIESTNAIIKEVTKTMNEVYRGANILGDGRPTSSLGDEAQDQE